jgi:hypothetical protein
VKDDNGRIDNNDVRLMVSGAAIPNEFPMGVVRQHAGNALNIAMTTTNWSTGPGLTRASASNTYFNRDTGTTAGTGITVSMTTGGSAFVDEILQSKPQAGIPGQIYTANVNVDRLLSGDGVNHNGRRNVYWDYGKSPAEPMLIAGENTNDGPWLIMAPTMLVQIFATDVNGANAVLLSSNGHVNWQDDPAPKPFPNDRTHYIVEISFGRLFWESAFRTVKPLFRVNSCVVGRSDPNPDPNDPGVQYPYPIVYNIDGIETASGLGFTGSRYRLEPYLDATWTYAAPTTDGLIKATTPYRTSTYYSANTGSFYSGIISGKFTSPTTGTGTRLKRVRMGLYKGDVVTDPHTGKADGHGNPDTTNSAYFKWGSWQTSVSGNVDYFEVLSFKWTGIGSSDTQPRIVIEVEYYANKVQPIYVDKVGWYSGATLAMDTTEFDTFYGYTDILGSAYEVKLSREELGLGILQAGIKNVSLDPATSDGLKQGARVTLQLNAKTLDTDADLWQNQFTGSISNIKTTYNSKRKVDIRLTAVDSYQKLANFPCKWGFNTVAPLGLPLSWAGVYSTIDGVSHGSGAVSLPDDNAVFPDYIDTGMKCIDSVIISRNTVQGQAFIDKEDVLVISSTMPAESPEAYFSDIKSTNTSWIPYSINGIDLGFDTTRVINQVQIETKGPGAGSKATMTNKESYELRGPAVTSIELAIADETKIQSIGTSILNKYETPSVSASYVKYPVRRRQDLRLTSGIEITDWINVRYADKLDRNFRVTKIEMDIRPGRMTVSLGFELNRDGVLW